MLALGVVTLARFLRSREERLTINGWFATPHILSGSTGAISMWSPLLLSRPSSTSTNMCKSAKIIFSYSNLFNLTTSYSSYFGGKKGISRNKTSFYLLMYKGHDHTTMEFGRCRDEIKQYLDAHYISSCEALWRLYLFGMQKKVPNVVRL